MVKRALAEAIWKWTLTILVGVLALGFVVIAIVAFTDDPSAPSLPVLLAIFVGFLTFSYIVYLAMKFIKEKVIESFIED